MASGRLGKAAPAANSNTDLYTVPFGMIATADVNLHNVSAADVTVEIWIRSGAANAAPGAGDKLDRLVIQSLKTDGWKRLPLSAGETITVRANAPGLEVQVRGFEERA